MVEPFGTETTCFCKLRGHDWKHVVSHAGRIDFCMRKGCNYERNRGTVNTISEIDNE